MIKRLSIAMFVAALTAILALAPLAIPATAQELNSKPYSYLSTSSTNATLVYGGPAQLQTITVINTNASTTYYLKLYNKATAPTCGTDTPVFRLPVPPSSSAGGGVIAIGTSALQFPLGFGFCLTGALADNDSSNAGTGVAINFGVVWQ